MAIQAGVGLSNNKDARQAGYEACSLAIKKAGIEKPDLVIAFSSVGLNQDEVVGGINEASGKTPLIGCSDAGQITNEGPNKGGVSVMAIKSDSMKFTTGMGGQIANGAREAGAALASDISGKAAEPMELLIMLTDVLKGNGADIVRGVQDVLGKNFIIVGGAAGDDFLFKETSVYYYDQVLPSSIVGAGLSGKFSVGIGVRHGWTPIGLPQKVTKSSGAVIEEIEGKPAVSIYEQYFGKKAEELKSEPLAILAITYPLGMSVEGSDELLIRDPITVDEKGAITCAAEIPQGSEVHLMIGSKENAIAAAKDAAQKALEQLGGSRPKAVIVFNCIARNKLFGKDAGEEIQAIQSILGVNVPLIGFYTYGEQAPIGGDISRPLSCFHNETVVILALGE
ncbi:MAG: FIST N-terminal domain-containing protein [Patescibacteria group bacterium]|nr:FIST N-terminal domain-containing protein [Patescibacteria group bacterium]